MLPDFKTYKATVIKTMWYWLEDIQVNGIEYRTQKYTHLNIVNLSLTKGEKGSKMKQTQSFKYIMLEQVNINKQKINQMDFTPFTKINSIEILPQNVKYRIIILLEDNTGENLDNFGYSDDFLDITPKE